MLSPSMRSFPSPTRPTFTHQRLRVSRGNLLSGRTLARSTYLWGLLRMLLCLPSCPPDVLFLPRGTASPLPRTSALLLISIGGLAIADARVGAFRIHKL